MQIAITSQMRSSSSPLPAAAPALIGEHKLHPFSPILPRRAHGHSPCARLPVSPDSYLCSPSAHHRDPHTNVIPKGGAYHRKGRHRSRTHRRCVERGHCNLQLHNAGPSSSCHQMAWWQFWEVVSLVRSLPTSTMLGQWSSPLSNLLCCCHPDWWCLAWEKKVREWRMAECDNR